MRTKTILLGSVSAIATAAAGAGHAQAAVTAPSANGYTFSVQGGLALTPAEMSLVEAYSGMNSLSDKMGSGFSSLDDLDQAFGYNAAVSIGKDLGNGWDIRLGGTVSETGVSSGFTSGYTYGVSGSSSGGFPSGSSFFGSGSMYGYVAESEKFSFQALDFEVGYSPILTDTLSVRLFGGVRAVHSLYEQTYGSGFGYRYSASGYSAGGYPSGAGNYSFPIGPSAGTGGGYSGASGYFNQSGQFEISGTTEVKTEFFGAGPRMGIDVSKRFEGTNFGISGRLAGSVLFGKQTTSYSGYVVGSSYYSGAEGYYSGNVYTPTSSYNSGSTYYSAYSSSFSVDKKIADIEAQVGFDYYLDDSTALTIGYQAEKFIDLDDSEGGVDHLTHGAFLKLSGSF